MKQPTFLELFSVATGQTPFPYQAEFAQSLPLPELIRAPTGSGKTATAILSWIWRFFHSGFSTPRRLVYCLPMRVLVEQTRDEATKWVDALKLHNEVHVHVLMGGEDVDEWDLEPEKPAILIGTQDMLLSRALNRGYGMNRYRWPMHFGLLNNDSLWVLDEIQIMGVGLATSTQLQAFRERFQTLGDTQTVWMSATLLPDWLKSIDFRERVPKLCKLELSKVDYGAPGLKERWRGAKAISSAMTTSDDPDAVAALIKSKHVAGSLTLAVVNTVERSRKLFEELQKLYRPAGDRRRGKGATPPTDANQPLPDIRLIHSRFRPMEREQWMDWLKAAPPSQGRIVISTQVVEAGVDMSARTLVTELAPWPSLVQRFGRCNRRGEFTEDNPAQIYWVDVPTQDEKQAAPYTKEELDAARKQVKKLTDGGLKSLHDFFNELPEKDQENLLSYNPPHVVRRKDFIDLFDTTPDLAGNDIDVSRFIREGDELDVQVFWRDEPPPHELSASEARRLAPERQELCSVPVRAFREFITKGQKTAHRWDALDGRWVRANADSVFPGQVFWVARDQGGYSRELGWDPKAAWTDGLAIRTPDTEPLRRTDEPEYDSDLLSEFSWQTIADHTDEVVAELEKIINHSSLDKDHATLLKLAARWHDWGKAHRIFQDAIKKPDERKNQGDVAKAPNGCWNKYERKHFRHELASALGVLTLLRDGKTPPDWAVHSGLMQNLALYLIAAHHGKVRLSIRSMPDERKPQGKLFARGVWDGDELPAVSLGDGIMAPAASLNLSPMQLGRGEDGSPSWAERMITLRDHSKFGPLRIAFLEAILRAADMRASKFAGVKAMVGNG